MASRRFSQAISEGDGISIVAEVGDGAAASAAESEGAEAVVVRGDVAAVRGSTELPILARNGDAFAALARGGADACWLDVERHSDDDDALERLHAEALELGLDCVVEVRDEEQLGLALERLDPEIFALTCGDGDDNPLGRALELLPDIPAGKLAVADVPRANREQIEELERAGVDAVIVRAQSVADLVGGTPPQV